MYTNVFLADPDLPASKEGDLRRLVPRQVSELMRKLYLCVDVAPFFVNQYRY